MAKVLITGFAGFIACHLARKIAEHHEVTGIDIIQPGEKGIHTDRLNQLMGDCKGLRYAFADIRNYQSLFDIIESSSPDIVIHLAASTGIAQSGLKPQLYFENNVTGFFNMLESCRNKGVKKIIYATSSSVYGNSKDGIFKETDPVEQQLSFYGATKRMDEALALNYNAQFNMQAVGLRFFTVYGSWVRKDMAAWKFMEAVSKKEKITLYNKGDVSRDFTHVSDTTTAITLLMEKMLQDGISEHRLFNIGLGAPVKVKDYFLEIARCLNSETEILEAPLPANELEHTHADTSLLFKEINFKPSVDLKQGVKEMTDWYKKYIA